MRYAKIKQQTKTTIVTLTGGPCCYDGMGKLTCRVRANRDSPTCKALRAFLGRADVLIPYHLGQAGVAVRAFDHYARYVGRGNDQALFKCH